MLILLEKIIMNKQKISLAGTHLVFIYSKEENTTVTCKHNNSFHWTHIFECDI